MTSAVCHKHLILITEQYSHHQPIPINATLSTEAAQWAPKAALLVKMTPLRMHGCSDTAARYDDKAPA